MALFFQRNFAAEFETLTVRLNKLKETLLVKKAEKHNVNESLEKAFATAAEDIDKILKNYQLALTNSTSESHKKQLLEEYETMISCLEAIAANPENTNAHELIKELEKDNEILPSKETLSRVGNALAAVFWLGVCTIASVSLILSISTIPADPVGGIAFAMISSGLMAYSYCKIAENLDDLFEPKHYYQNQMQINSDEIALVKHVHDAYEVPALSM
ncbi:hypothetical protein [Legionella brunensis]|uniref:DUF5638 domain-containing protein n=1 Tax=Legionella brunensis TaxID=29422 RepID=A0A0W0S0H7_9GAMM|nr:hypothetical protein [Legionella brunensis]KTC76928.1 hypothetical protein Lbru_3035 [Legionella brunensis]